MIMCKTSAQSTRKNISSITIWRATKWESGGEEKRKARAEFPPARIQRERERDRQTKEEAKSFFLRSQRRRRSKKTIEPREETRSLVLSFPPRPFFPRVKMMDYMAYERKMNSIYDMVGEGKYKVRKWSEF